MDDIESEGFPKVKKRVWYLNQELGSILDEDLLYFIILDVVERLSHILKVRNSTEKIPFGQPSNRKAHCSQR